MLGESPDIFLNDFGVIAEFNGEKAKVIFDMPDQIIAGDVVSAEYTITYKTGTFYGLGYGSSVYIDGEAYTAHSAQKQDDGVFMIARLTKS